VIKSIIAKITAIILIICLFPASAIGESINLEDLIKKNKVKYEPEKYIEMVDSSSSKQEDSKEDNIQTALKKQNSVKSNASIQSVDDI